MPRNISFSMTTQQVIDRTKTVTRRRGWQSLKPGEILWGVEKAMGLKPGEKIKRLCKIRVTSVSFESLCAINNAEVAKEGFPDHDRSWFMMMWVQKFGGDYQQTVTRIEFEYLEEDDA